MTEQPHADADTTHEELTAYLDGELDADSASRVEQRLARDPVYQAELQRLARAWDLLDGLPRAAVGEGFTKTTIEMVALAAGQEAEEAQNEWPRRRRRQRLVGLAGALAAGLVGFAIGHWMWPNPNDQLLRDLPVIDHFELFYQADNMDFLQMLEDENLFVEGDADHAS